MSLSTPPPRWPQRAGRHAPLGVDGDGWEIVADRAPGQDWVYYQLRSTGEVWRKEPDGTHYAPPWWDLPEIVRRAVWRQHEEALAHRARAP